MINSIGKIPILEEHMNALSRLTFPIIRSSLNTRSFSPITSLFLRNHYSSSKFELHDAVKKRDLLKIESIVTKSPKSLFEKDNWSRTPFHIACSMSNNELSQRIVNYLINKGALINEEGSCCRTPLRSAVEWGNVWLAKTLLAHKADPTVGHGEWGPFHDALCRIAQGHCDTQKEGIELAHLLLSHGVDINATVDKLSPLLFPQIVSARCPDNAIRFLIDNGCKIDVTNQKQQTPVHFYLEALLNQPLDFDAPIERALHILLERFRNVNAADDKGFTPLHLAIYKQRPRVAARLLDMGADPDLAIEGSAITPMMLALYRLNRPIASLLVNTGANTMPPQLSSDFYSSMTLKLRELRREPLPPYKLEYIHNEERTKAAGIFCVPTTIESHPIDPYITSLIEEMENDLNRLYHPLSIEDGSLWTPMANAIRRSEKRKIQDLIQAGWHAEVEFKLSARAKEKIHTCIHHLEDNLEGLQLLSAEPSTGISLESEFMRAISNPNPKYALALIALGVTPSSFEAKCGKGFVQHLSEEYAYFQNERPTCQSLEQQQLGIVMEAAYKMGWIERTSMRYKWWEEA